MHYVLGASKEPDSSTILTLLAWLISFYCRRRDLSWLPETLLFSQCCQSVVQTRHLEVHLYTTNQDKPDIYPLAFRHYPSQKPTRCHWFNPSYFWVLCGVYCRYSETGRASPRWTIYPVPSQLHGLQVRCFFTRTIIEDGISNSSLGHLSQLFDRHGWDFQDELGERYESVVKLQSVLGVSWVSYEDNVS